MTDDICNLVELRYFALTRNTHLSYIPNCIASNLKELFGIDFEVLTQVEYITPQLWKLPNLNNVKLYFTNVNESSFYNFDGWSDSLERVTLQQTRFCREEENWSEKIQNNSVLMQFVTDYDTCEQPCTNSNDNRTYYNCVWDFWKDGVCDSDCWREVCILCLLFIL